MFIAYELALHLISAVEGSIDRIGRRDADLARQIRRAASGVPLQIAEGNRRRGKDRLHLFRTAAGSADEVQSSLQVAMRWHYVDAASVTEALSLCDRLLAILWRLTERTSPRSSAPSRRASEMASASSAASESSSDRAASSAADTSPADPSAIS